MGVSINVDSPERKRPTVGKLRERKRTLACESGDTNLGGNTGLSGQQDGSYRLNQIIRKKMGELQSEGTHPVILAKLSPPAQRD